MFTEVDMMMEFSRCYHPTNKIIRSENGDVIIEVIRDKIVEVFGLNLNNTMKIKHA